MANETSGKTKALAEAALAGVGAGAGTKATAALAKRLLEAKMPPSFFGEAVRRMGSAALGSALGNLGGMAIGAAANPGIGFVGKVPGLGAADARALEGLILGGAAGSTVGELAGSLHRAVKSHKELKALEGLVALDRALHGGGRFAAWSLRHPVLTEFIPFGPMAKSQAVRNAMKRLAGSAAKAGKAAPIIAALLAGAGTYGATHD